ncbi:hypothetical protein KIPB_007519, partial [Kipferlia bialata]
LLGKRGGGGGGD